jgi:hypothetical protein
MCQMPAHLTKPTPATPEIVQLIWCRQSLKQIQPNMYYEFTQNHRLCLASSTWRRPSPLQSQHITDSTIFSQPAPRQRSHTTFFVESLLQVRHRSRVDG